MSTPAEKALCARRGHAYRFIRNVTLTQATQGQKGSLAASTVKALFRCSMCGQERYRAVNPNASVPRR